jgi:hypothetical protein
MSKFSATTDRTAQLLAACVSTVFFLSGVAYLCLGHRTVTHQDFWRIYDVCLNHTWLESALLKHNGHSLFFPSLIWLVDLRFFHGNQHLLFYIGLTLMCVAAGFLLIPVWYDKTVNVTAKIMATLVVTMGAFWMGKAHITASGGFNCNVSLMMAGAEASFIFLPSMRLHSNRFGAATVAVIAGGVLASFSFSAGLATWPVLILLAWCLRLPWRSVALVTVAAITAAVVFLLLPSPVPARASLHALVVSFSSPGIEFSYLCRLLSAPVFHAASAWQATASAAGPLQSSLFALIFGMIAFIVAIGEVAYSLIRRDLATSSLRLIGIALVSFNLIAMGLVVIGRSEHFRVLPFEVAAPRYFFHSTLFWTGLLLVVIQRTGSVRWLRWPVYILTIAGSILAFPSHYKAGLHWRHAAQRNQAAALALVNGVRDDQQIRILAPADGMNWVYRVSDQMRSRRLDMFAEGLQDWIGLNESNLFNGRHKRKRLTGQCRITATMHSNDGRPAARVVGVAWTDGKAVPKTLVIVDSSGVICGVARSSEISPFVDRIFYLNKFARNMGFVGYIRDYDPKKQYAIRCADRGALSNEKIVVSPIAGHSSS